MSIAGEIERIKNNVSKSYGAVSDMGGELPAQQNSDSLPAAIRGIEAMKPSVYDPQGKEEDIFAYVDEAIEQACQSGGGLDVSFGDTLTVEDDVLDVSTPVNSVISQEEYDALSPEQKTKGLYVIPGESGSTYDIYSLINASGAPEMHRNIFRGKNLGTSVTDTQKSAIQDGTFKDLFVGDYWVINSVNWRIVDMDYFLRCGDTEFTKHHLVIVPDTVLYNAQMNTGNVTESGYMGSEMYKNNLTSAKNTITSAFGALVLTHKDYLTNAVTNGYPSAGAWVDSTVELMNEIMVYGTHVYSAMNYGATLPNKYTTGKQQFALFALDPKKVNIRVNYWLRDVVSSTDFAGVSGDGGAGCYGSSYSRGVRPYFCIG